MKKITLRWGAGGKVAGSVAGALAIAWAGGAKAATNLTVLSDIASGYNLYLSGDMGSAASPIQWSDVEGRAAIGGSAYMRGYATAMKDPGGVALTVGQNLTYQSGTIYGDVVVGGVASFPTNYGGTTVNGNVSAGGGLGTKPTSYKGATTSAGLPIDFAATNASLQSASAYLNSAKAQSMGTVGSATNSYGTLTLISKSTGVVFFDLTASQLVGINGLNFQVDPNATVIVNVTGQMNGTMSNFGFLGNYQGGKTLFNFADTSAVNMNGIGFFGSILAPYATINANNGQLNGAVMAKSWTGGAQINRLAFAGDLPGISPTPEPGTWMLMITGVALVGDVLRRRRAAQPLVEASGARPSPTR